MEKGKKNGKWKVVDLSLLPKEIKPEYIYGCKYEERNEKFCEVITLIENRLKEIRKNLKKLEIINIKTNKENIEKYEKLKKLYEKRLNEAKEKYKNRWCPPPICKNVINIKFFEPFKIDKNLNINENKIKNNQNEILNKSYFK